ncbi:zinc-binding dehydrogenase [Mumia zhuanghuii]|uniref:zinc-binding dehydrogenase n=1 Tax=Mumia zhuanghuii TaxID=2585211 RepID=UPI003626F1AF
MAEAMRAATVTDFAAPLSITKWEIPQPGSGEVAPVLCAGATAVSPSAFGQSIGFAKRGGTISYVGLPLGDFPTPIFDVVLKGLTLRGSIVGARQDMVEALDFPTREFGDINDIFDEMEQGKIDGRMVIQY